MDPTEAEQNRLRTKTAKGCLCRTLPQDTRCPKTRVERARNSERGSTPSTQIMAAAEAKTNDAEAPAPPKIVYATNPEPTIAHGASKDVTDCDYGRLLLQRWGVPQSRFIGNMLVLYRSSSGKPRLMLGPYWTMLLFVTVPLAVVMPALICAFLLSTKVHIGVQIAYGVIVLWTACALASVSLRNPGLVERRDSIPCRENGKPELAWVWNDQARTYKPPGARYCDWCNAVFYEFDHTCPWTGTAIARNNMRSFRSFVALVQLELWCTIAVVILWFSELVPR